MIQSFDTFDSQYRVCFVSWPQGDAIFYLLSVMAEDQETQCRGIVTVGIIMSPLWYETKNAVDALYSSLQDVGRTIEKWCPLKCHAHHYWIHDKQPSHHNQDSANIACPKSPHAFAGIATDRVALERRGIAAKGNVFLTGEIVFYAIMNCLGREYRIRTRIHKG